jgi:RimJ/RimL family protein N-acetyltransferase
MELITKRLRLRLWRDEDLPAFADLNSDPRVMRYMLKRLDRAESDAFAERIKENFARNGFGLRALRSVGGWHSTIGVTVTLPKPLVLHVTMVSGNFG